MSAPVPSLSERNAATRRPRGRAVVHQRWAHLLFVHWQASPEALARLLPAGLDLDTFEGHAFVGLVPFTVTGTRPRWTPALPFFSRFHEVNLRTYVHRGGRDPGVWFFSLDAGSLLAVQGARAWYRLPYRLARIRLELGSGGTGQEVSCEARRVWPGPLPAACSMRYGPAGAMAPAVPGTLEHFLIERYVLYGASRGRLYRARVHHPRYPVQAATVDGLEETFSRAAGVSLMGPALPSLYAREVEVEVFPPVRL